MSSRRLLLLPLAACLALAACDRPFVPLDPPRVEVLRPGLDTVLTDDRLVLALRATALRQIVRVEVNGEPATYVAEADAYLDTLDLGVGANALLVEAIDREGNAGRDTLYAVYLPLQTAALGAFALPEPRAEHAATLLADGRVLVTGGAGSDGRPLATAVVVEETGSGYAVTEAGGALVEARLGHTSTLLPDGRVLLVGGATTLNPGGPGDFVATGEVYDPASGTFTALPFGGEPVARAFHTAHALSDGDRTFVYLYGGRGLFSDAASAGTLSDVTVLEVRTTASVDSLVNLSPAGGVGAFPALAYHVQLPLPPRGGFVRSLVAGTYTEPGGGVLAPTAFRFLYTPSAAFFPFEILEERLAPMREARTAHAGALLGPGLALLTGGHTPGGEALRSVEVFSDEAGRFFAAPPSLALRSPRGRHTATLLPSGRILLLGGVNAQGTVLASAELVLLDSL